MGNYTKKLESSCDDEMFSSGKIIISWQSEDQDPKEALRICRINFDLQRGSTAVLRADEIDELIRNLQTVKERIN